MLARTTMEDSSQWAGRFPRYDLFDALRLDPYYRSLTIRHPDLADRVSRLIERTGERRRGLVHGDYSPKNLLVWRDGVDARSMLIDFEVCHFGDISFDPAFLLNHLLLKMFYHPADAGALAECALRFWVAYCRQVPDTEPAVVEHLGFLMLARVDGKSPVEYLDLGGRARVRDHARSLIFEAPPTVADIVRGIGAAV